MATLQGIYEKSHYDKPMPDLKNNFQINCPPATDLYRKPPSTHLSNAPIIYQSTTVGAFRSAGAGVSGAWQHDYDQGGLAIIAFLEDGSTKWVKAGVELVNGQPQLSVMATDRWSDWGVQPLPEHSFHFVKIEFERDNSGSLLVWNTLPAGKRLLRKVTWWAALSGRTRLWIGPYAARPHKGDENDLAVDFEDLSITVQPS